jgi:hypothetical protein
MAGILDSKTRFIDFVVTQEGRRQLASGKMRAEYASVSDINTFYNSAEHDDVSNRLFFQVMDRHSNMIVLEKDDSGKLVDFDFSPTGSIVGNNIFDKDATSTNQLKLSAVTGSNFTSTSTELFRSFLSHFKSNGLIGTSFDNGSDEFELDKETINFAISNSVPFPTGPNGEEIDVDKAEPFFLDSKLSHLENFKFLPPVNTDGSPYGNYSDIGSYKRESWDDISNGLGIGNFYNDDESVNTNFKARQDKVGDFEVINRTKLTSVSNPKVKQFQTINFKKTSRDNNLLIQLFEDSKNSELTKLDIIDAGSFSVPDSPGGRVEKRIFYVGKVYFDNFNTPTFINMFTIIFD